MVKQITEGKNTFTIIADEEALLKQVDGFDPFEEDTFTQIFVHWDEPKVTEEQFNKNKQDFIDAIKKSCTEEAMEKAFKYMPKKKNGTFCKNRKNVIMEYGNSIFFQEWHNTWRSYELRFSATNDTTLVLNIADLNYTPC